MAPYLARKLLSAIVLVWAVLTATFLLMHAAPGDPIDLHIDAEQSEEDIARLREHYGLDQPLPVRYARWFGGIARGDLGISVGHQRPVADVLREAIPRTLQLTSLALVAHLSFGTLLGLLFVRLRRGALLRSIEVASLALYSLPAFWLGLLLQLFVGWKLGWLPVAGTPDADLAQSGFGPWLAEQLRHLAMPVFVLGIASTASVARLLRSTLVDVLEEPFIRTAHAKGLAPRLVLLKHALRPAAIVLVTLFGLAFPVLLSGSIATEVVFGWPGMGRIAVEAIFARDHSLVLATTMISAILVVLGNFLADVGYALVDPRLRSSDR